MHRVHSFTPDGRPLTYYLGCGALGPDDAAERPPARHAPTAAPPPAVRERRWDRESEEWVVYAASRQGRPAQAAEDACPFCPGETTDLAWREAARHDFRAAVFENRFAPLGPLDPSGATPCRRGGGPRADAPRSCFTRRITTRAWAA